MYTKEQVIKGLQCCILRNPDDKPRCDDCPFDGNCVNRLKMAALEFLIKSDFEVVREMLERSEKMWYMTYIAMSGHKVIEIYDRNESEIIRLSFDEEGNIL